MIEHSKSVEKQEQEQFNAMRKTQLAYKIRKGLSDNHETIPSISYAEYHTNKLNGQRPFDRPHGRKEYTRYRNGRTNDMTYSKATATEWIEDGCEVFEYNSTGKLVKITNSTKRTRRAYAGTRVKLEYCKK